MINHLLKVVFLAVFLSGCGGSGGSGEANDSADTFEVSVQNLENAAVKGATLAHCSEAEFAIEMLESINSYRAQARFCGDNAKVSVPGLSWNCELETSAKGHSEDMAENNFFSHTSSNGLSLSNRIDNAGYHWKRIGENIAAGQTSIDQVMRQWIESPGHCNNIMNPNFTEVGAALVIDKTADYRIYWTQNFGTPL